MPPTEAARDAPANKGLAPSIPSRGGRLFRLAFWILIGAYGLRAFIELGGAFANGPLSQDEWSSGLIPFPGLLVAQVLILGLVGKICVDFWRRRGFFFVPRRSLGSWLLIFGAVYLVVMATKYAIRMGLYPHQRWTGGSIPILLNCLLAATLLAVGAYHWARTRHDERPAVRRTAQARWGVRAGRLLGTLAVLAGIFLWLGYQLAPTLLARQLGIRGPEYAVHIERGVTMTTSDGTPLVSDVYHPRPSDRTPTILVRVNYSKTRSNTAIARVAGRMWAERGYTVVVQGTRGRYESGGEFYPFLTERRDGIETLAWLRKRPWFDGRLGMWGGSYFGYTQWVIADQLPPESSALMVQIASTDVHGMFYPGGAFSLESALFWAVRSHGEQDVAPAQDDLQKGYDGFPLIEADDRAVEDVPFFDDWASHPERDRFWADVDGSERPRTLQAPALLMAGWYDPFLPTEIADFITIRHGANPRAASATRLIIGPWGHARDVKLPDGPELRPYRLESFAPSVAWFDEQLKARPSSHQRSAPVRIFVMGENVWRDEQDWPLARTRFVPCYLRSGGEANTSTGDGTLTRAPAASPEPPDTYSYDPRDPVPTSGGAMLGSRSGTSLQNDVEARPDVLVYTTPPLQSDVEVTGPIRLILYVSTTAPSTDFTGKLVDVHPDGRAYNVSDGVLRLGYGPTRNTLAPDRPTEMTLDLWPTSMVFRKGHRMRLEVSSSNYPRFDRNPNTGAEIATETNPIVAHQTVSHGATAPSRIILPIIPRVGEGVPTTCSG